MTILIIISDDLALFLLLHQPQIIVVEVVKGNIKELWTV